MNKMHKIAEVIKGIPLHEAIMRYFSAELELIWAT